MDHRQPPQPRNDFMWQDGPHHGHDGWNGPLHVLFLFLFIALLVVAVVWIVRRFAPGVTQAAAPAAVPVVAPAGAITATDPAVATLRMRYAKGEVSREEFQNAIADLTGTGPQTADWPGADAGDEATTT